MVTTKDLVDVYNNYSLEADISKYVQKEQCDVNTPVIFVSGMGKLVGAGGSL